MLFYRSVAIYIYAHAYLFSSKPYFTRAFSFRKVVLLLELELQDAITLSMLIIVISRTELYSPRQELEHTYAKRPHVTVLARYVVSERRP